MEKLLTFDDYIVSDCNNDAYTLSEEFLKNPFGKFVALCGPTASGKTYLLSAILTKYKKLYPKAKIKATTYEEIATDYIEQIKCKQNDDFYNNYLTCDLLIVDNMQFLVGKKHTQVTFARLFLEILSHNKSVVIAGDKPVNYYRSLFEPLQKCLGNCFIIELKEADIKLRKRYLCGLIKTMGFAPPEVIKTMLISDDTIPFIAFRGYISKTQIIERITGRQLTEPEYIELLLEYKSYLQ